MYESYWNLKTNPFRNSSQADYYFQSPSHEAALLKLRYTIENRKGAALLCGPAGTGKTLLTRVLVEQLAEGIKPVAWVVFPQMPASDLLAYLASELGASSPDGKAGDLASTVRQLRGLLEQNAKAGKHALVIIDEAHLIEDPGIFETLRLLLNFQHDGQYTLTLLLVGQPPLLTSLARIGRFHERLAVRCLLRALTADETAGYIRHRLKRSGATREIFKANALQAVHELSGGVPSCIHRLCDMALLVGYAEEAESVTPDHVEAVADELLPTIAA